MTPPTSTPPDDVVRLIRELRKTARRQASRHTATLEWKAADALERSYQDGLRDMREQAAKVAHNLSVDMSDEADSEQDGLTEILHRGSAAAAAKIAAAIRALPTEPLGGEQA